MGVFRALGFSGVRLDIFVGVVDEDTDRPCSIVVLPTFNGVVWAFAGVVWAFVGVEWATVVVL